MDPRIAASKEAQASLAQVQDAWVNVHRGTLKEVLRVRCRNFLRDFAKDDAAPLVRTYLAISLLGGAEDRAALALIAQNTDEREGTTRDLMDVVRGHLLRKDGRPEAALEIMRPLVGKLVDPVARSLLLEEVTLAAMESHLDFEVIATMDAWLQDATGDERERVTTRIGELMQRVPETVIESTYQVIRARGKAAGYSLELKRIVFERMAQLAQKRGDATLARSLLEGGAVADAALQELASSTRGIRTVRGRTIGVVLPSDDESRHDDAAEVVRGISWALGLPDTDAAVRGGVRLVTRGASLTEGAYEHALEELAGEGASIIIGGFETVSAKRLLAWAAGIRVSVIALASPGDEQPPTHGVILGESLVREAEFVSGYLRSQTHPYSLVESHPPLFENALRKTGLMPPSALGCDLPDPGASGARFPVASPDRSDHDWILEGPESCLHALALDVAKVSAQGQAAKTLYTTLETGIPHSDVRLEKVQFATVAAGILPNLTKLEQEPDADIRKYRIRFGSRPTYWSALGRDAGVLAKRATQPLPLDAATKEDAILHRRSIVEASLLAARQKFWSSEQETIGASRRLDRTLSLRRVVGTP